jgi:hypothetical protein
MGVLRNIMRAHMSGHYIIAYNFETRRKFEEDKKLVRAGRQRETERACDWICGYWVCCCCCCEHVLQ